MKKILVMTDFSENAANAASNAVSLSEKLHTNIILFNAYVEAPVLLDNYGAGPWGPDGITDWESESMEKLQNLAQAIKPAESAKSKDGWTPAIQVQSGEGSPGAAVTQMLKSNDVELLAIGARSDAPFDHFFNGSDTSAVIHHSTRPVLILTQRNSLKNTKKVIFATDYDPADIRALRYLVHLGKVLNYHLAVVHINVRGKEKALSNKNEAEFLKQAAKFNYPHLSFKEVQGVDVITRLNTLCREEEADILALIHHKHSLFMRLVEPDITKKAMKNQKTALLVIPSEMEE
ncbi:hypothetical protein BH09BAC6_BH09BAC6_36900 [soil metagenome]